MTTTLLFGEADTLLAPQLVALSTADPFALGAYTVPADEAGSEWYRLVDRMHDDLTAVLEANTPEAYVLVLVAATDADQRGLSRFAASMIGELSSASSNEFGADVTTLAITATETDLPLVARRLRELAPRPMRMGDRIVLRAADLAEASIRTLVLEQAL